MTAKRTSKKNPTPAVLRDTAGAAAILAGKVLMKYFGKRFKVSEKPGAGLVTPADFEAQETIVRALRRKFPDFGFLTEEAPPESAQCPGRWIIDPLDGTTNFVHGFPMFCVSIAAEWNGELVAGAIYHPVLKELHLAATGKGATVNGKKMKVSQTNTLTKSLLSTGFTYSKEDWLRQEMAIFEKLSSVARAVRRPGSAALDLVYTARGIFDGFWERRLSPWDVAAGAVLVREAGGMVTDFKGRPFSIANSQELLATNQFIHPLIVDTISKNS